MRYNRENRMLHLWACELDEETFLLLKQVMQRLGITGNRAFLLRALEALGGKQLLIVDPETRKAELVEEITKLKVELGKLGREMKKEGLEKSFYPFDTLFKEIEKENPGLSESDLRYLFTEKAPPSPKTARYLAYRDLLRRYLAVKEKYQTLSPTVAEALAKMATKFQIQPQPKPQPQPEKPKDADTETKAPTPTPEPLEEPRQDRDTN
jgi:hypothetical protein